MAEVHGTLNEWAGFKKALTCGSLSLGSPAPQTPPCPVSAALFPSILAQFDVQLPGIYANHGLRFPSFEGSHGVLTTF